MPDREFTTDQIERHAAKLRANHHEVLCAAIGNNMRTIGERLNIPLGTVKSRLHRARLRLGHLVAAEERENGQKD